MLQQSRYAKAVKLNLGLDEQIPLGYPGVIPRSHPRVAGLQFLAWKGTGQAPAGCDGLGVVFRETGPIEELTDTALELLASLPGVKRPPQVVARHLERIPHGVPLFPPGRYRALADSDPLLGRVALAGDYLAGPSIEAAVRSGLAAAMSLTRVLRR